MAVRNFDFATFFELCHAKISTIDALLLLLTQPWTSKTKLSKQLLLFLILRKMQHIASSLHPSADNWLLHIRIIHMQAGAKHGGKRDMIQFSNSLSQSGSIWH